ncbi:MAG: hypothetical protein ACREBS_03180 [Nitrososphaerales archaeon]
MDATTWAMESRNSVTTLVNQRQQLLYPPGCLTSSRFDQFLQRSGEFEAGEKSESRCVMPSAEDVRNYELLVKVLRSHIWEVISSQEYGHGVNVFMKCKRCLAHRLVMMTPTPTASEKSADATSGEV